MRSIRKNPTPPETGDRMKISTKGRYALRLMYELACHAEEGYLNIRAIAQRQQISEKYL